VGKPALVVEEHGYRVHLYYYDPALDIQYSLKYHNPFGVLFWLSKLCASTDNISRGAGETHFNVYFKLLNLTKEWGVAPFYHYSALTVVVGVPGDPRLFLPAIVDALKPLESEILRHGIVVEVYRLDYNCSEVADLLASGQYVSRLNASLNSRGDEHIPIRWGKAYSFPLQTIPPHQYHFI
jgi:hypothetical protein